MREDPAALHSQVADALSEVTQALELLEIAWERSRDVLSTAPVSTAQTRVMYIIQREPGINLSALRHHLSIAAPSVTRLCDRLQAAGFLRRTPRPEDRREVQLELTDAGAAHLREIRRRREQALSQAMNRMTPEARQALSTGLVALCEAAPEPLQPLHHQNTA
ncbi:MarR family winged helix-turn-helix transcriptional regulator [Streptomyces sp. OR43]|uniref:MarR family winged helix-turn-helix transcriptional regulator n=1 Tax=Streptomyces sp. or43 TaxID=2478957 RepID=UPI0011CDE47D|nr:MarR family transcriptional regulator [Streptomyces sp. or43]TXS42046.1 MarR family transcriptional regulator [Streptomyces sp. or43]